MEHNNYDKLQILTAKTWDFHVRINEKISENGFSLCNHCSNHGRNCVVSDTSMEEKEKMIAIRDSLEHLHNILLYLQRVRSRQEIERDEALGSLKESRKILIERVNEFSEKERKFGVVDEVIKFIGDGKSDDECPWLFNWKFDEKCGRNKNVISNFLVRITKFGLEFGVIFASIYASVELCKSREQNHRLMQKEEMDARILRIAGSDIQLDVSCGRG